jgi:opacity protein-like surface antigen
MNKNTVWLAATAISALVPLTSYAADMPVKARPIVASAFDWSGVYAGVHAGYGGGMKDWDPPAVGPAVGIGTDFVARGPLVGGQVGINKQLGSFVLGVELDGSWADIKGSQTHTRGGPLFNLSSNLNEASTIDGLLTFAGRAGLAADRWFVYAKAGLTAAHEHHSFYRRLTIFAGGAAGTSVGTSAGDETRVGPMLGFGTEYALTGNWSVKGEYDLHYLGSRTTGLRGSGTGFFDVPIPRFNVDAGIDQTVHAVKLGINYRLGGVAVDPSYAPAPPAPGTNWTGGYVGVEGGYGWGGKAWPNDAAVVPGVAPSPQYDMKGWLAGANIGANVQAGSFVFGVEGEILGADIRGSQTQSAVAGGSNFTSTISSRIDWLALATARAGFVVGSNVLLYGKGGVAIANETHGIHGVNEQQFGAVQGTITRDLEAKAVHTGVVVGVGGEYALAPNWSVKLEYDYIRMFQQKVTAVGIDFYNAPGFTGPNGFAASYSLNQDLHLVKVGVNYHFNPVQVVTAKY